MEVFDCRSDSCGFILSWRQSYNKKNSFTIYAYFSPNFGDIVCRVAELNAALCLITKAVK